MFLNAQHKKDPYLEIRQSLEILSSLAQSNRQIVTTISQIVSDHLAKKNASHLHPENTGSTQQANWACKTYHQPPPPVYDIFAHNNSRSAGNLPPTYLNCLQAIMPSPRHGKTKQKGDNQSRPQTRQTTLDVQSRPRSRQMLRNPKWYHLPLRRILLPSHLQTT